MISIEGAGLIAQILPVLLLIAVVERRSLGPIRIPPKGAPRRKRRLAWVMMNIATIASAFLIESLCIVAVSTKTALNLPATITITLLMLAVGASTGITLSELYISSLIGIDKYLEQQKTDERKAHIRARAARVRKLTKRSRR